MALTVVLAAVVALVAVQPRRRPLPSTISTNGWKTYTDTGGNVRFRYPPDWRLQLKEGFGGSGSRLVIVVPPGIAIPPKEQPSFSVSVDAGPPFWIGEDWWRLIWPEEYGGAHGSQATAIQGGVQYRREPRCHLRLTGR